MSWSRKISSFVKVLSSSPFINLDPSDQWKHVSTPSILRYPQLKQVPPRIKWSWSGVAERFGVVHAANDNDPHPNNVAAKKHQSFTNRIISVHQLRRMFPSYLAPEFSDEEWMFKVFIKIPHQELQSPFEEILDREGKNTRPNEVNFVIHFGEEGEVMKDIQSTEKRWSFYTFNDKIEDPKSQIKRPSFPKLCIDDDDKEQPKQELMHTQDDIWDDDDFEPYSKSMKMQVDDAEEEKKQSDTAAPCCSKSLKMEVDVVDDDDNVRQSDSDKDSDKDSDRDSDRDSDSGWDWNQIQPQDINVDMLMDESEMRPEYDPAHVLHGFIQDDEHEGDHHMRVKDIQIINPDTGKLETIANAEFSNNKYMVLTGLLKKDQKSGKTTYEYHLARDMFLLTEVQRTTPESEDQPGIPLSLVSYWWWPIDSRVLETRQNYSDEIGYEPGPYLPYEMKEYAEFLAQTPVSRIGHTTYRFPLPLDAESAAAYFGDTFTPWKDLAHRNQDRNEDQSPKGEIFEYANSATQDVKQKKKPHMSFDAKHIVQIPGYQRDYNEPPQAAFYVGDVRDLFKMSAEEFKILVSRNFAAVIVEPERYEPGQFVANRLLELKENDTSLRQRNPCQIPDAYSVWNKKGTDILLRRVLDKNRDVETRLEQDENEFKKHMELQKDFGRMVLDPLYGPDDDGTDPGVEKLQSFLPYDTFIARDWCYEVFVDTKLNPETKAEVKTTFHLECVYPKYIHKNAQHQSVCRRGNFIHGGARGIVAGYGRFQFELIPFVSKIIQFHRCPDKSNCPICKRLSSASDNVEQRQKK